MGSAPIPLPYKSWNEVPTDQLETNASINFLKTVPTHTNTAVAPSRSSEDKLCAGIKPSIIKIAIALIILLIITVFCPKTENRNNIPRFRRPFKLFRG